MIYSYAFPLRSHMTVRESNMNLTIKKFQCPSVSVCAPDKKKLVSVIDNQLLWRSSVLKYNLISHFSIHNAQLKLKDI